MKRDDPSEVRSLGPLFEPAVERLYGRSDPPTSRQAAEKIQKSLGFHQRAALALVTAHPGSTCKELARRCIDSALRSDFSGSEVDGVEIVRQRIGRRLNELQRAGVIRREGERDGCSIWWPA